MPSKPDTGSGDDARAERTVAVVTARRAIRPGVLWGLVFGGTIAVTEAQYHTLFPTAASRATLKASMEGNTGFAAVFGQIRRIDTVAGYTAYKTMFTGLVLAAIWGLLIATRVTRGDEDTGRWELLLSGRTTRGRAAVHAVAGLAAGLVALWVPTAVFPAIVGRQSNVDIGVGAALFLAAGITATAAMFMAIGLLLGQLAASRHDANVIGGGVLAGFYLVRMVADSDSSVGWLRWASPFGWIEELRPLTGSKPLAFVPIVVFTVAVAVVACELARRRDLGASAIAGRDRPQPRTFLLGGQAGLTVRLTRSAVTAWVAAMAATGLVFGLVTQAAGSAAKGSPTLERVIGRLGAKQAGAVLYLGFVFVIAAGLVAVAVAGQIAAIRNEEASGHLDNLLVRPVSRWKWLGIRLGAGAALVVSASVITGVAAWIGAATQHTGIPLRSLLEAGLNVAPPAVFVLGLGGLVYGVWPRGSIGVTYGVVVWSFLVETIALIFHSNHWLKDTSPFLHITPAPAADPNWTAAAWLVGLGLVAGLTGIAAFNRRDLVGA